MIRNSVTFIPKSFSPSRKSSSNVKVRLVECVVLDAFWTYRTLRIKIDFFSQTIKASFELGLILPKSNSNTITTTIFTGTHSYNTINTSNTTTVIKSNNLKAMEKVAINLGHEVNLPKLPSLHDIEPHFYVTPSNYTNKLITQFLNIYIFFLISIKETLATR